MEDIHSQHVSSCYEKPMWRWKMKEPEKKGGRKAVFFLTDLSLCLFVLCWFFFVCDSVAPVFGNVFGTIAYFPITSSIYRRGHGEILELVELSLDTNLAGNAVRYRFPGCCLLPGAAVHELPYNIAAVFATETSVHRLTFPHPSKLPHRVVSKVSGVFFCFLFHLLTL